MDSPNNSPIQLTQSQLERIEKNKQRALILRQGRLVSHPYSKHEVAKIDNSTIKIGTTKYKDTGGGFLLEETEENENLMPAITKTQEPPIIECDRPFCLMCEKSFATSWLLETFDYKVCDECKDPELHKLVTKTEAMKEYLLKECDLDKREPPLKFIRKKNPHNVNWGEMKLYLQQQIEERALEVWGTKEKIEEEIEQREEKRVISKSKKYQKQMKQLKMNMRSSLYDKTTIRAHAHEFGDETYNEEDDNYHHACKICDYEETFEKM